MATTPVMSQAFDASTELVMALNVFSQGAFCTSESAPSMPSVKKCAYCLFFQSCSQEGVIFHSTWHHTTAFAKPSIFFIRRQWLCYVVGLVVSSTHPDTPKCKSTITDEASYVVTRRAFYSPIWIFLPIFRQINASLRTSRAVIG